MSLSLFSNGHCSQWSLIVAILLLWLLVAVSASLGSFSLGENSFVLAIAPYARDIAAGFCRHTHAHKCMRSETGGVQEHTSEAEDRELVKVDLA